MSLIITFFKRLGYNRLFIGNTISFLSLGILLMSLQSIAKEKWYTPVDIGQHIDTNNVTEEKLSKDQAREIFKKDSYLQEDASKQYEKSKNEWFKNNSTEYLEKFKDNKIFYLDKENHPVSAYVYMFSKSEVKIYIQFIYGHSRWHHYYIVLKDYLIERDPYIDEVFNLNDLEKQYSFSYKGIGSGTSLQKVQEILGNDYYEYAGQSPQYQNIYYEKYNIEIIIQDWVVKYLRKGKPGWMDTEMKFKNLR